MINRSRGFTLVELNLAIVFVALLLLAVALTTLNVSRTYQYGVSLKTINQLGREVVDQMRRDAASSSAGQIQFTTAASGGGVGRLCLGNVSYVFNSAGLLNGSVSGTKIIDSANSKPITLARIDDKGGEWCKKDVSGTYVKNAINGDTYTEMLLSDVTPVAIHAISLNDLASTTTSGFTEGLVEVGVDIGTNETQTTNGDSCKPPSSPTENFDNCVVRHFVMVVRVTGG